MRIVHMTAAITALAAAIMAAVWMQSLGSNDSAAEPFTTTTTTQASASSASVPQLTSDTSNSEGVLIPSPTIVAPDGAILSGGDIPGFTFTDPSPETTELPVGSSLPVVPSTMTATTAAGELPANYLEVAEDFVRAYLTVQAGESEDSRRQRVAPYVTDYRAETLIFDAFEPGVANIATVKPIGEGSGPVTATSAEVRLIALIDQYVDERLMATSIPIPVTVILSGISGEWLVADHW